MQVETVSLWRQPEFMKLWGGQTISLIGSQVTLLAFPLTAIVTLGASPSQIGLLTALQYIPFLAVGPFAGVWVDRKRRGPILVWTNLGRCLLLSTIPLAAGIGQLRLAQLYIIGFLASVLAVFFEVAYQSYLPTLVGRAELLDGNSKLEISRSSAQIAGPGFAGALVQLLTAPLAIALDALSFLLSAVVLSTIRTQESLPPREGRRTALEEAGQGWRLIARHPALRAIAVSAGTYNLFAFVFLPLFPLYATRGLGVAPAVLGAILAIGSSGFLAGAFVAGPVVRHLGLGSTLAAVPLVSGSGVLLVSATGGPPFLVMLLLVVSQFLYSIGGTVFNVNSVSLRQAVTPGPLLGHINATMRVIAYCAIPLGSFLGGLLAERIGVRSTLIVAGVGITLASCWIVGSPVRTLRLPPTTLDAAQLETADSTG